MWVVPPGSFGASDGAVSLAHHLAQPSPQCMLDVFEVEASLFGGTAVVA